MQDPLMNQDSPISSQPVVQKLKPRDAFNMVMLLANHMMAQWMAYMIVYANPGDDSYTSLQIDLGLSETEYGVLSGVTYAIINGVFCLATGVAVDRYSRKNCLVIAGTLWAALTLTQSFAVDFVTILIPRILMEICVTMCGSAAFSIISDYYCENYRGRASSIYTTGLYLGVACSSLTIIFVNNFGWRNSYRIVSGISIIITILTMFIQEPKRGAFNSEMKKNVAQKLNKNNTKFQRLIHDLKVAVSSWLFLLVCVASSLRFFGGYALGFWAAKYYKKEFSNYQNEYSIVNSLTILILGVSSAYTGGVIGDYFETTHPESKALISGVGPIISFPFIVICFTLSNNFWLSVTAYAVSYFTSELWLGACVSMIQCIYPAEVIGLAVAIFGLCGGFSGAISTLLLGVLGDHFKTDDNPKTAGNSVTICVGISYLGCAPLFIICAYKYRNFIFKERRVLSDESENETNQLKE